MITKENFGAVEVKKWLSIVKFVIKVAQKDIFVSQMITGKMIGEKWLVWNPWLPMSKAEIYVFAFNISIARTWFMLENNYV